MAEIPNPNTSVSRRPVALLTGASRGIGSTIALQFAQSDYDLFLPARKERKKLEDCAAPCRAAGACVVTRFTGISDSTAYAEILTGFNQHFSTPDLLVASTGISRLGLLQNVTPDGWGHMMHADLSSCFYLSRLAIPRTLYTGGGKLVFLSPVWGSRDASCEAAYSAARGGAGSLTRALAKELAPSNIQINAIASDAIDTDMDVCLDVEERYTLEDKIPVGRLGVAEEVAVLARQLTAAPAHSTGNIPTLLDGWAL